MNKVIPPAPVHSEPVRRRFLREARAMHPAIAENAAALWLAINLAPHRLNDTQCRLLGDALSAARAGLARLIQIVEDGPHVKEALEHRIRSEPELFTQRDYEVREKYEKERKGGLHKGLAINSDDAVRKARRKILATYNQKPPRRKIRPRL